MIVNGIYFCFFNLARASYLVCKIVHAETSCLNLFHISEKFSKGHQPGKSSRLVNRIINIDNYDGHLSVKHNDVYFDTKHR